MYNFYPKIFVQPPGCTAKILWTMKITALLLFVTFLQVSAGSFAQNVTLSEKNASLSKVFDHIRQQTGYDFLVNKSVLKNSKPIDLQIKNAGLEDVLEKIFADQPLEYKIVNRLVLVKVKEKTFLQKVLDAVNAITVKGKVVDEMEKGYELNEKVVRFAKVIVGA